MKFVQKLAGSQLHCQVRFRTGGIARLKSAGLLSVDSTVNQPFLCVLFVRKQIYVYDAKNTKKYGLEQTHIKAHILPSINTRTNEIYVYSIKQTLLHTYTNIQTCTNTATRPSTRTCKHFLPQNISLTQKP